MLPDSVPESSKKMLPVNRNQERGIKTVDFRGIKNASFFEGDLNLWRCLKIIEPPRTPRTQRKDFERRTWRAMFPVQTHFGVNSYE
jgi:hypothetical protein